MIVLLGASGYVGQEFVKTLEARKVPFSTVSRKECNIYDAAELAETLKSRKAQFLVNCAGYTGKPNVDACEKDRTACLIANGCLPGIIDEACEQAGINWGHVSSGCIFTGEKPDGSGFKETDPPNFSFRQNNCSFYSGTKALGEECLQDSPRCYIWRLRIPFNHIDYARNYLTKVMRYDRLLEARNSLSHLEEFVNACLQCWDERVDFGIYNLTNTGSVTTREVVELIRKSGVCNKEFSFFTDESEFMQLAAITPRSNTVLDNSKALAAGLKLSTVEEALERSLKNWIAA